MSWAASRLIAPPEPALPSSEYEKESKLPVILMSWAASRLIAPPEPALPSSEYEKESKLPVILMLLAALMVIAPPMALLPERRVCSPLVLINPVLTFPDAAVRLTIPPTPLNGCTTTSPPRVIPAGTAPLP